MYSHPEINYKPQHPMLKSIKSSQTEETENLGLEEVASSGYFGGSETYEEVNFVDGSVWSVEQPDFAKIKHGGFIDKGKFAMFGVAVGVDAAKARKSMSTQAKKVDEYLKTWKPKEMAKRIVQGLKGNQNMPDDDAAQALEALNKVGELKTIAGRWSKKAKDGKFQKNRDLVMTKDGAGMDVYKPQAEWDELNGPGTLYSNVTSGEAYNRIAAKASGEVKTQIESSNGTQGLQVLRIAGSNRFYSYVVIGISPKKTEEDYEFPYKVITN